MIDIAGIDWTPFIALFAFVWLAFAIPAGVRSYHRTTTGPRAFTGTVDPDA